jgi:hypothetical protein
VTLVTEEKRGPIRLGKKTVALKARELELTLGKTKTHQPVVGSFPSRYGTHWYGFVGNVAFEHVCFIDA